MYSIIRIELTRMLSKLALFVTSYNNNNAKSRKVIAIRLPLIFEVIEIYSDIKYPDYLIVYVK